MEDRNDDRKRQYEFSGRSVVLVNFQGGVDSVFIAQNDSERWELVSRLGRTYGSDNVSWFHAQEMETV